MDDVLPGDDTLVRLRVMGVEIHLRLAGSRVDALRDEVAHAWSRCTVPDSDAPVVGGLDVVLDDDPAVVGPRARRVPSPPPTSSP